ncbi:MAG: glycosyltransferase [Cyclobacteriaceae bacterium]|nr:glycosyltransferase [Cyclobacteriaceae bacterium]
MKKILYLSYDGLLDPLGQSQILPYLEGLAALNYSISIISFEKKSKLSLVNPLQRRLNALNIFWIPLHYHKKPVIVSTIFDLVRMYVHAKEVVKGRKVDLIHVRSYLPALLAKRIKHRFKIPYVFDIRGFWIDERIEGKIWNPKNPIFKVVIRYLRKEEKLLFSQARYTIVLTAKAKELLANGFPAYSNPAHTVVIPCCVDSQLFSPSKVSREILDKWRGKFNLLQRDKIIIYHGSWGTWYLTNRVLEFMACAANFDPDYFFLIVTPTNHESILKEAKEHKVPVNRLGVVAATRSEIPELLRLATLAIFFINPGFSKQASSPTRLAEIVSMALPLVTNQGIGDNDVLLTNQPCGFLVKSFNALEYAQILERISSLNHHFYSQSLLDYFSLEKGINAYDKVYQSLANTDT